MERGPTRTIDFESTCPKGRKMERVNEPRQVGLARALSKLGFCSRSQAAKLIRAGRVRLNGATRRDPETPVRLERDRIEVDRNAVTAESKIYLMLNKPRGVVTTASDEKGRQTVYSLLGEKLPWVGPVGRLDKASEGLLLSRMIRNGLRAFLIPVRTWTRLTMSMYTRSPAKC